MTDRDGRAGSGGRLVKTFFSGFWTPSQSVVDPEVPYLPLEDPAAGVADVELVVADCTVGVSADAPALVQNYLLAVADVAAAVSAESPALVQANVLAVQDATVGVAADSPALTQAYLLAVADATVSVAADNVVLELPVADIELVVQDATVAVVAESPALVQANVLAAANATVALSAEGPALEQANILAVDDSVVAVAVDAPALVQANLLAAADSAVGVSVDSPALTQASLLSVQGAAIGIAADSPALVEASVLAVADATVAVTVDAVAVLEAASLTVQDVTVAITADDVLVEAGVAEPLPTPLGFPIWSLAALPLEPVTLAVEGMHVATAAESPVLAYLAAPVIPPRRRVVAISSPARIREIFAEPLARPAPSPHSSSVAPGIPPVSPRPDTLLTVAAIGVAVRVGAVTVATIPPEWEPPEPWSLDQEEAELEDILLLVGAMHDA